MLKRQGIKKGVYILPNLLTLSSLFCGFFAIVRALKGEFEIAAWAILAGGIFDGLDGRVARLTHTQSDFGVELDSLVDLVTFGVAPALVAYMWDLHGFHKLGWGVCFVYVACGALRLARYNVQFTDEEKKHFQGVPIPLAAYTLASYIIFNEGQTSGRTPLFLSIVMVVSILMVSQIPYRSFKDLNLRHRQSFVYLILVIGVLAAVSIWPQTMIFTFAISYICFGLLEWVVKSSRTWRERIRMFFTVVETMRTRRLEELDDLLSSERKPFLKRAADSLKKAGNSMAGKPLEQTSHQTDESFGQTDELTQAKFNNTDEEVLH